MDYIDLGSAAAGVLMVPYLLWGVYTLRQRLTFHAEFSPVAEAITLAGLFIFFAFEIALLKPWRVHSPGAYVLAMLGLFASGAALYGPLVVSFASHVLVDMVMPGGEERLQEPQLAAGEACERQGDYEGALKEFLAQGNMFPENSTVAIRIADNLMKLDRAEEAAEWFERSLATLDSAERSLTVTNRLFEIYHRRLNRPLHAVKLLETYLEKYPATEYAESVRNRLKAFAETHLPTSDTGTENDLSHTS